MTLAEVFCMSKRNNRFWCAICGNCEGTFFYFTDDIAVCQECLNTLKINVTKKFKPTDRGSIKYVPGGQKERSYIFNRDGGKCVFCESEIDLEVDHIFPRSKGGTASLWNLQTLCKKCNRKKRAAVPVGFKATFLKH